MTARDEMYKALWAARGVLETLNTHARAHEIRQDDVLRSAIGQVSEESMLLIHRLKRLDAQASDDAAP